MEYLRGGSILWVDLSTGKIWTEPTSKYDDFIGGRGINTKIVYDHVKPGTLAYDPGNVIVFGTGPLTGTFNPGGGRTEITGKSPMNDLLGMTNMGGYWAPELKYAGYDHLAVIGKAEKPVYISIQNDDVQIRDASSIWGKDTYEVTPILRKEMHDPDVQVVMIGQAGENLVRYASVLTKVGDAAGKTGMGGVMGSKNLKAVAVRGTKGVHMADPDAYFQIATETRRMMDKHEGLQSIVEHGTLGDLARMGTTGMRTRGNMLSTTWPDWDTQALANFSHEKTVKRTGCFSCPIRCMDVYDVEGIGSTVISCAVYADPLWKVESNDPYLFYESVRLCQTYGIDFNTIYTTIAWAVDMYERGILTDAETGGLEMKLGSRDTIVNLVHKIAAREGIGDLLADGSVRAAQRLGRGSEKYVYHTKGIPHQSLNPMNSRSRGLATAVGPRGDLLRSDGAFPIHVDMAMVAGTDEDKKKYMAEVERRIGSPKAAEPLGYDGKGKFVAYMEKVTAISDLLLHCKWHGLWSEGPVEPDHLAKIYSIGTGQDKSAEKLWDGALRLRMLERAFNLREGLTRDDDSLPKRFFEEPLHGKFPTDVLDHAKFESMKDEYYREMGLDEKTGLPTREALEKLGLKEVADDLERAGRLAVRAAVEVEVPA